MPRLACVELPAFPLQLLLRSHPEWAELPAALIDADKPQGRLLWVNGRARRAGILPGARYGAALALLPELRAGVLSEAELQSGLERLLVRLHAFSPEVEPLASEPGVFWLDADGLTGLFPSLEAWAQGLREALLEDGYHAAIAVGFRRFGTYAVAKLLGGRKAVVLATPEREDTLSRSLPLGLMGLAPEARDALAKLGVQRVGDFLALPARGLKRRFGPELERLHRFASGDLDLPLQPVALETAIEAQLDLGYAEKSAERLLFAIKPLVDRLLAQLQQRGEALVELWLGLTLDGAPVRAERIRTAAPTLSSVTVMELVRLRLEGTPWTAPVLAVQARALGAEATTSQLALFEAPPRRDPSAAARAFARLRAAFGEQVIVKAILRDRHTPEGRAGFEALHALPAAKPRSAPPSLVRRLLARPEPLAAASPDRADGWLLAGPSHGPVARLHGPYRLSGAWWRMPLVRDYYFAETHRGALLWVYYDHERRRWFLQGEIR